MHGSKTGQMQHRRPKIVWPPPGDKLAALRKQVVDAFMTNDREKWENACRELNVWLVLTGNKSMGSGGSEKATEVLRRHHARVQQGRTDGTH